MSLADLTPNVVDRLIDERGRRPVAATAGDVEEEIANDLLAVLGMHDFGVELQPDDAITAHRGDRRVRAARQRQKSGRHRFDPVAVAHPDRELIGEAAEDGASIALNDGMAVLA